MIQVVAIVSMCTEMNHQAFTKMKSAVGDVSVMHKREQAITKVLYQFSMA